MSNLLCVSTLNYLSSRCDSGVWANLSDPAESAAAPPAALKIGNTNRTKKCTCKAGGQGQGSGLELWGSVASQLALALTPDPALRGDSMIVELSNHDGCPGNGDLEPCLPVREQPHGHDLVSE